MARARAAKWQFVALHGKPTSSALDRTKARRLDDRPVSCHWVGTLHIDNYARNGEGSKGGGAWVVGICPTGIACLKQIYYKQQPAVAVVWAISTWLGLAPALLAWPCTCRFVLSANLLRDSLCVCVCMEWGRQAVSQLTLGQLSTSILESPSSAMSLLTTLPLINSSSTWPKHLLHQLDGHRLCLCVCLCVCERLLPWPARCSSRKENETQLTLVTA